MKSERAAASVNLLESKICFPSSNFLNKTTAGRVSTPKALAMLVLPETTSPKEYKFLSLSAVCLNAVYSVHD